MVMNVQEKIKKVTLFKNPQTSIPRKANRKWMIYSGAEIYPVIEVGLTPWVNIKNSTVSVKPWYVTEENLFIFDNSQNTTTHGNMIFVSFPEDVYQAGEVFIGFIVHSDLCTPLEPSEHFINKINRQSGLESNKFGTIHQKLSIASSSSNTIYETIIYTDGTTSCNCKGWINRRTCKHIKSAAVHSIIQSLPQFQWRK